MRTTIRRILLLATLPAFLALPGLRADEKKPEEKPAEPASHEVPDDFLDRVKRPKLKALGGDEKTEAAVAAGLDWLARHQSADGRWMSEKFQGECDEGRCAGPGNPLYDIGVTGLALLAFLGDGQTHEAGPHRDVVKKGLVYLTKRQGLDPDGCAKNETGNHFSPPAPHRPPGSSRTDSRAPRW